MPKADRSASDGQRPHVKGRIEPIRIDLAKPGESLFVESGFHHDATNLPPPWGRWCLTLILPSVVQDRPGVDQQPEIVLPTRMA